jgi:hypothetical protein
MLLLSKEKDFFYLYKLTNLILTLIYVFIFIILFIIFFITYFTVIRSICLLFALYIFYTAGCGWGVGTQLCI